jgi:hypothetical protein
MKKQNAFADIEDAVVGEDAGQSFAYIVVFLIFIGLWIAGGSFWFAAVATLLVGGFFAAVITGVIGITAALFARRDSD